MKNTREWTLRNKKAEERVLEEVNEDVGAATWCRWSKKKEDKGSSDMVLFTDDNEKD